MQKNNKSFQIIHFFLTFLIFLFFPIIVLAENPVVNLSVSYKKVNFTGKTIRAIAVNNQIPAPVLHFKEGDHVTINVYNHLDKGTSMHWHGLLLPWQMDGVEGVTQPPILPGGVFHYKFTLKQSGTYWYHAHAGLQEQEGVYGAFIIDPVCPSQYHYDKDYPVVLSDWSNTNADQIYANLKKSGDYYSPSFPLQSSLLDFLHDYSNASPQQRSQILDDYKMMQQMRMSLYDFSDVAYDAFLLNGQSIKHPWETLVQVGDTVRLRFIGANAGTISHVKMPGTHMKVVHVQGHDVRPYVTDDFFIAPGETYDVLIKINKSSPYIIYAESSDKVGATYGALITSPHQRVNYHQVQPFLKPPPVSREMMDYMMQSSDPNMAMPGMDTMMHMDAPMPINHKMSMQEKPSVETTTSSDTKYKYLVSPVKTNDPNKPVQVINMELYGYMDRFVWFINGEPENHAKPIILQSSKRYRIIFRNVSMMHHPMHIHGHFFILRNGHGAYDPLLHTIDVPPGATMVADFDADAKGGGQWLFHCHFLYHMMAGMSRVFQYDSLQQTVHRQTDHSVDYAHLIQHPMAHKHGQFAANFLDVGIDPFDDKQKLTFKTLWGSDYHKLQLNMEDAEMNHGTVENADMDIFYWHLVSEFWAIKGGANYFYRPTQRPYWQPGIGIEGLMPYFIAADIRNYYHGGSDKLDVQLSRDTQITHNFFIRAGIRSIFATKTVEIDKVGDGLNQMRYSISPYYRLTPRLTLFLEYEHESDYGAYATQLNNLEGSSSQNSYTMGVSFLF